MPKEFRAPLPLLVGAALFLNGSAASANPQQVEPATAEANGSVRILAPTSIRVIDSATLQILLASAQLKGGMTFLLQTSAGSSLPLAMPGFIQLDMLGISGGQVFSGVTSAGETVTVVVVGENSDSPDGQWEELALTVVIAQFN